MPLNRADAESSVFYHLGGHLDPRIAPNGLDAPQGAIYALGDGVTVTALQKTSVLGGDPTAWDAVGGGGSQIPVVLVDPVAPALNEQWILRTPPTVGLGISGITNGGPVFPGNFIMTVASNVPSDLAFFASMGPIPHAINFISDGMVPPNTITISAVPSPNGMEVRYNAAGPVLTLGDIVLALNAWATANLTIGGPIASLDMPPAASTPLLGFPPVIQQVLPAAGTPEAYVSKIQGSSGIKTQSWV